MTSNNMRTLLLSALQLVVALLPTGDVKARTGFDRLTDPCFGCRYTFGHLENLVLAILRDHDNTVGITAQKISGTDARITDIDHNLARLHLDAILTGAHRVAATEDRVTKLKG